jgi:hypothetical protein
MSRSTTSLASGQSQPIVRTDRECVEMAETDPEKQKLSSVPSARPPPSDEELLFQPNTFKFWMTMFCNFLALFLVALDRTIVATAVPRITDDFNSLGDIGWYGSAYMLTTSCAQLAFGKIYKYYDRKWCVVASACFSQS